MDIIIEAKGNQELGTLYYGITIRMDIPTSVYAVHDKEFVYNGIKEVLRMDQDLAEGKEIEFQKIKGHGLQDG